MNRLTISGSCDVLAITRPPSPAPRAAGGANVCQQPAAGSEFEFHPGEVFTPDAQGVRTHLTSGSPGGGTARSRLRGPERFAADTPFMALGSAPAVSLSSRSAASTIGRLTPR